MAEIDLDETLNTLRAAVAEAKPEPERAQSSTANHRSGEPLASIGDTLAALEIIPNADAEWEKWNRIGMALWRATGGDEAGFAIFDGWSKRSKKYDGGTTRERWNHYRISPPDEIGAGSIFYMAREAAPWWIRPSQYADQTQPASETFKNHDDGSAGEGPNPRINFLSIADLLAQPDPPELIERMLVLTEVTGPPRMPQRPKGCATISSTMMLSLEPSFWPAMPLLLRRCRI